MIGYIIRRVLSGLLVVWLTSIIVFALFFFGPDDPGQYICQNNRQQCPPEIVETYNKNLGFYNSPVSEYGTWAKGIFTGREIEILGKTVDCDAPCFGASYSASYPEVTDEIVSRLPTTISLGAGSAIMFLVIGVTLGTLAARRRGTSIDRGLVSSSLVISSIPVYLFLLLAMLYLVIVWQVFPEPAYNPITENPITWFTGLFLPWICLGLYNSTQYARFSRGSMVEALSEDYVRTAKAKGLRERTVNVKHALRAAIVPVVTIFGLDLAGLLAGTIFTERIFSIDGIGRLALDSVIEHNFPVITATVLFAATLVVAANIVVDVLYSVIDPRVRLT